ncbi:hypothetical protein RI129_011717 [Pyrocoelia pectoralis]|uniref:Uncharacterized protein n=1 Tax=Pyrocoelia pectoralis TaxID=417401 RepID=A0AAN7UX42_9COLE
MNAFYVIVSIPILLVLAGFNHAHGFTTFGKTPTNPLTQAPPRQAPAKSCGNHTECWSIPKTSCVAEPRDHSRKSCLCGDNKPPANGQCFAIHKGPFHLCDNDEDCVDGATCVLMPGLPITKDGPKHCKCIEGFIAVDGECSGSGPVVASTSMGLVLLFLIRTLF